MKTLYDLLGARPQDDAERLRVLFRRAAKANHPDLHPGDPYAAKRFREMVQAYAILRDATQRANYDGLLEFERERFRRKLKHVASNGIAVAGLAIVLGAGHTLFAYMSKTHVDAVKVVEVTARAPSRIAGVQPAARADTAAPDQLRDKSGGAAVSEMPIVLGANAAPANDPDVMKVGAIPSPSGLSTEVARPGNGFGGAIHQPDAKTAADRPDKNDGMEALDQKKAQSVEVLFSAAEREAGVVKSSASDFAVANIRGDMKIRDTHDIPDIRMPETKMPARPRGLAKRKPTSRAPFEQASLENRNTPACAGSCVENTPPLFGVGF
jgi:curved DNA-binding protein CbpA